MWKLQDDILDKEDKNLLKKYIDNSERFTQFTEVLEFEKNWSNWQQTAHSTYVNSGSSADLIMLDAVKELYQIPDDSEVLVPCVTWTTNITSVIQTRLKPIFVDVNLTDFAFDYNKLEESITPKTRILLLTHLIGIPANMSKIQEICDRYNLILLEDCCESHGASFKDIKVGNFGLASTFSFYWGHHMTTIEGGMVCTQNDELDKLLRLKRSHGLARELKPEFHQEIADKYPEIDFNFLFLTYGYNFRNTELHASIGNTQIKKLDNYIRIRNENHDYFNELISTNTNLICIDNPGKSSFCLPFLCKEKDYKIYLQKKMRELNIEYRPMISGNLLVQPCFTKFKNGNYPNADFIHSNGFYIGNNQFVSKEKIDLLKKVL